MGMHNQSRNLSFWAIGYCLLHKLLDAFRYLLAVFHLNRKGRSTCTVRSVFAHWSTSGTPKYFTDRSFYVLPCASHVLFSQSSLAYLQVRPSVFYTDKYLHIQMLRFLSPCQVCRRSSMIDQSFSACAYSSLKIQAKGFSSVLGIRLPMGSRPRTNLQDGKFLHP